MKYWPLLDVKLMDADVAKGILIHAISVEEEDRDGDVVHLDGLDVKTYRKNPVVLWMHGRDQARGARPIGRNEKLALDAAAKKPKLDAQTQFAVDTGDPFVHNMLMLYAKEYLTAWSMGFMGREVKERQASNGWPGRDFVTSELLEYSAVAVPSNRGALTQAIKSGDVEPETLLGMGFFSTRHLKGGTEDAVTYLSALMNDNPTDVAAIVADNKALRAKVDELQAALDKAAKPSDNASDKDGEQPQAGENPTLEAGKLSERMAARRTTKTE
jgi:hypothetical protein